MNIKEFKHFSEKFADLNILRYNVEGFEKLSQKQKRFAWFLSQAAYSGRDIFYDQNFKYNLVIRKTLEEIYKNFEGNRDDNEFKEFEIYLKRFWVANGIHHHYSNDKIKPGFSQKYLIDLIKTAPTKSLPLNGKTLEEFSAWFTDILFSDSLYTKKVNLDTKDDLLKTSAVNFYENVCQSEVEGFYNKIIDKSENRPVSHGLNSKVVKENNEIREEVYKIGGLYSDALEKIAYWLKRAIEVAETDKQKKTLELLVKYYETGDLKLFNDYNIAWLADTKPVIDVINGFIEVYDDPLGIKGTWESTVWMTNLELTKIMGKLSDEAAWFEKHSPIMDAHKRKKPQGMSYKVIDVFAESGAASPITPIGINLPNEDWIRASYGSKSVSLVNVQHAIHEATKEEGTVDEFFLPEQKKLVKKYSSQISQIHVGLHEVIGHGSGKIVEGVGTPKETIKSYASTIEEARADLVSLYFMPDKHLVDLGILPDMEAYKAEYIGYFVTGLLTQLSRIEPGKDIEESHMRNRQLIAKWCYEKGKADKVVEIIKSENKTYIQVNDFEKLRVIFGKLLREIQRIKSEGDYEAAKNIVDNYGVKVDTELHSEILERYESLKIAPYYAFINPELEPIIENNEIVDVKISYPDDFAKQMLGYSEKYSVLFNK